MVLALAGAEGVGLRMPTCMYCPAIDSILKLNNILKERLVVANPIIGLKQSAWSLGWKIHICIGS